MSEKNKFADTLNLPQTEFPMRANLAAREPDWVKMWEKRGLYKQLREQRNGRDKFILHCGPPYANGNLHMGHLLSYVLKDFIVRAKGMAGFDTPFLRGWDCHGLPIEWKIEQELRAKGKTKEDFSTVELRALCRKSADEWSHIQKAEWDRFGVMADSGMYRTMDAPNEAGIVRELGKLAATGGLYKGRKSVMWSPVEETALAEAEIEYADHESTAIYVAMPLQNRADEHVVIWTTTPWTMPANKAVAYGKDFDYAAVKPTKLHEKAAAKTGQTYWVAKDLVEDFTKMTGMEEFEIAATQKGAAFKGWVCNHPFYEQQSPLIEGFHVTTEAGTGFVHIAPAHGAEDFQIGLEVGLDTECHVDGKGCYDETVAPLSKTNVVLNGMLIWDAQKKIVAEMTERGVLLRWSKFTHSYPVSWRSKKPVIFRTTPQWMVSMEQNNLRQKTLDVIHGLHGARPVKWIPAVGENRIGAMIEGRPDWCISRQRVWGVPVTIFRNVKTDKYVFDAEVFATIAAKIETMGIDAWDTLSVAELVPAGWLEANGLTANDLEKETDVMDVWIDSGTSHAHVLRAGAGKGGMFERVGPNDQNSRVADMYLEGSDQHRGWFHSSILMSVANYGDAPYDQVLTHGFVVDGEGRKMSKSLGNGIAPNDLMKKYGMDITRLWVASADYSEDIRLSDEIMGGMADAYRRFRNTYRYLLGNLNGFNADKHTVPYAKLPELEKWVLARIAQVSAQAQKDYDAYKFHKVFQNIYHFCSQDLSNLYFDIRKDALYCDAENSDRRRACQTVLLELLKMLTTHMAPLTPFTTDEVWREQFGDEQSVHLNEFSVCENEWNNAEILTQMEALFNLRRDVNVAVEAVRNSGELGGNVEADVTVGLTAAEKSALQGLPLAELLIVSGIELADWNGEGNRAVKVTKHSGHKCPRCWSYHDQLEGETCSRCATAVNTKSVAA